MSRPAQVTEKSLAERPEVDMPDMPVEEPEDKKPVSDNLLSEKEFYKLNPDQRLSRVFHGDLNVKFNKVKSFENI